jgi:choline dehydrogenase
MTKDMLHVLPYQAPDETGAWRFFLMAFVLAPKSRGRMFLTARHPSDPPTIEFTFLFDPQEHDAEVLAHGVRVIQDLARHPPLSRSVERANLPAACLHDRTSIKDFVRAHTTSYAHSVGTCRMGPSPADGAVVDSRGRVHGLSNVFVADASLIPEIPRANTKLTCMLVGLRIAELLAAPSGAKSL